MSLSINNVTLAGNCTRDVQCRQAGDSTIANFGLAINRKWKSKTGEAKEEVTFVDIEAFGKTAEFCSQYLAKGKGIYVEGRLRLDTWEDKNGGGKRSKMLVVADRIQFTDSKREDRQEDAPAPAPRTPAPRGEECSSDSPPF